MRRYVLPSLFLALSACGGSPSRPSAGAASVTITAAGMSAAQLDVTPGTRVLFVNNDTRSHNMTSDPHPEHNDCAEINAVGLLQPGQSRESGNMNTIRSCGFHDHDDPPPGGARWSGRITVR